ncbi:hypothetical protein CU254_35470 [Amycolatopsis sp. AA4]|nr:hypothetical protein CU254_35470 [Amycolatopsis sp. AA4]EFL11321.1 predicted protein [Streptomyces sp. AA4]
MTPLGTGARADLARETMSVPDLLAQLLRAWRRDVLSTPIPQLVDPAQAARLVRDAARVHASPDEARTRARNGSV